jgi:hypothetical protein
MVGTAHRKQGLSPINLALLESWPHNYRIPDLVLLTPDRFHIDRDEYFEGAPTAVIEIRSPGDESIEKLPFSGCAGGLGDRSRYKGPGDLRPS